MRFGTPLLVALVGLVAATGCGGPPPSSPDSPATPDGTAMQRDGAIDNALRNQLQALNERVLASLRSTDPAG